MESLDDVTDVTEVTTDNSQDEVSDLIEVTTDTGQAEFQTIVSQNERLIELAEHEDTINYYQLAALLLVVAVLGILVGQGFVKIFKR